MKERETLVKVSPVRRELHKLLQNLFVLKTSSVLSTKVKPCAKEAPPPPSKPPTPPGAKPPTPPAPKRPAKLSPEALKALKWKRISFLGALPAIGIVLALVLYGKSKEPTYERRPFVKYDYLRIRRKRFPWGEGNKSLFHNAERNPLPDGYED